MSYPSYPQGPGVPYGPPPDHPRSMLALILGIISIVLCLPVVGPFAWIIGRKAVREIDASGGTVGGRSQAMVGYVLGLIATILLILGVVLIVVLVIIVVSTSTTTS